MPKYQMRMYLKTLAHTYLGIVKSNPSSLHITFDLALCSATHLPAFGLRVVIITLIDHFCAVYYVEYMNYHILSSTVALQLRKLRLKSSQSNGPRLHVSQGGAETRAQPLTTFSHNLVSTQPGVINFIPRGLKQKHYHLYAPLWLKGPVMVWVFSLAFYSTSGKIACRAWLPCDY